MRDIEVAVKNRHRRLVVVQGQGTEPAEVARSFFEDVNDMLGMEKGVYVGEFPRGDPSDDRRYSAFGRGKRVPYAKSKELLGQTYDFAVLDAFNNLPPRDLGIVVETVRGPGLIFILLPPFEEWIEKKLFFHQQYVVTPPYSLEDCGNIYQRRFVKKIEEHPVYIFEGDTLVKKPKLKAKRGRKKKLKIPKKRLFPEEIYKMAATQNQIDVLKALEGIKEGDAYVIMANRGRGKSVALGLFLAGMAYTTKKRIVVTAPSKESIRELKKFYEKALKMLGGGPKLRYVEPLDVLREKGDILVVDEAAGIYVSLLREFLDRFDAFVFSTTVHGYEGTGRLFQYRFLPILEKRFRTTILKMEEPIRYGENDPVERWLYDVLLLDAEPASIKSLGELSFKEYDKEELFLKRESKLREYIGIYVFAHYRNNPRDIAILSDAPNQRAFAVESDGKVVASLQIAEEGGLDEDDIEMLLEGETVQGNIIPDIMLKYYEFREFARLKGMRIVRIAVHPEYQGKGIGSYALSELEESARVHWLGSSFGASPQLIKFWIQNGFIPVHVSPHRNPESGEYSTIVIKPLKSSVNRYVNMANYSMKNRLMEELDNYYFFMEPLTAVRILRSGKRYAVSPPLSEPELTRLKRYVEGKLLYDAVSDVVRKAVKWMYLAGRPRLEERDDILVVEKVLKKKKWREVSKELKKDPKKLRRRLEHIVTYIWEEIA